MAVVDRAPAVDAPLGFERTAWARLQPALPARRSRWLLGFEPTVGRLGDVAMRIAELPDSSLVATRIGSDVRRVVVGSPAYLSRYKAITEPANLAAHEIIAFTNFGIDSWSFAAAAGSRIPRVVHFRPRLTVNTVRAALASAIRGRGLTRLYSYHIAEAVRSGQLQIVLQDVEHPPVPVHLLTPTGRSSVPKVRAIIDFPAPRLRSVFSRLAMEARTLS
jgi:DNA-binding transcriptional LysR family regulator